jgi:antitoxin component YwqK of YwqJK toxin-antitoxin module
MKKVVFTLICSLPLFLSCQKTGQECDCVSQQFVHKYGFPLSEKEWKEREKDGQIITRLKNGSTITRNYVGGVLHGATTITYPHSPVIKERHEYDTGSILKHTLLDSHGIPAIEKSYELDDRIVVTQWNDKGVPLSIEEYENDLLSEGQYFNSKHELESSIEDGAGVRLQRDHGGLLLAKDTLKEGKLVTRTTFYPDGRVAAVLNFNQYKLHGKYLTYSLKGEPLMEMNWDNGILQGSQNTYFNGIKVREIPYVQGKKHGIENQFNDKGTLIAEIHWEKDQKHGSSRYYENNNTNIQWYFRDEAVTLKTFEKLDIHEKMIADLE